MYGLPFLNESMMQGSVLKNKYFPSFFFFLFNLKFYLHNFFFYSVLFDFFNFLYKIM
jgi:hypothetical protein